MIISGMIWEKLTKCPLPLEQDPPPPSSPKFEISRPGAGSMIYVMFKNITPGGDIANHLSGSLKTNSWDFL